MEKIKKIIENIKNSIPFLKKNSAKKNSSDNDAFSEMNIENESIDAFDSEESSSNDGKKVLSEADKERKKKIMVIVVLAIAFFLFGPEDEENEDGEGAPKVTNESSNQKNMLEDKTKEKQNIIKNVKNDEVSEPEPREEFVIPEENVVENEPEQIKAPEKLSDLTNFKVETKKETEVKESPFEKIPKLQDLNIDQSDNALGEQNQPEKNTISDFNKISEKLDLEINESKVIKVNYEELGRGLAYNCLSGYWVCLNKVEYMNCRENLKWAEKLGNKKECVPQDVYGGIKDCQIMQVHFINTNSSVGFCN